MWKIVQGETEREGNDRVNLTFETDGPARFQLMVDSKGNTILFGYRGQQIDTEQECDLAFDTDGSLYLSDEVQR